MDRTNFSKYIDIAKVSGSEYYKSFMLTPAKEWSPDTIVSFDHCPLPRHMCAYFPVNRPTTLNPLAPMIKELVAAAESKLETKFDRAGVSVYAGPMDNKSTFDYVEEALREVNATWFAIHPRWDAEQMIRALNIEGNCSDDYWFRENLPTPPSKGPFASLEYPLEMLLLVVDYTNDSMTVQLLDEFCEETERTGWFHSDKLGFGNMDPWRSTSTDTIQCDEALRSGFDAVFNATHYGRRAINWVLVTGEKADDESMNVALRQFLKERFSNGDNVSISTVKELSPDPTYAMSRATAWWPFEWSRWTIIECGNQYMTEGNIF